MIGRAVGRFTCVLALAAAGACGESAGDEVAEGDRASDATGCSLIQYGAAWWNGALAPQTEHFVIELDATPSASNMDAVIGLSSGAADAWSDLAAIVRFNTDGMIDVRDGDTYRAVQPFPYEAGATYRVRLSIDVVHHNYSVHVAGPGTYGYVPLAVTSYAFRTEQQSVTELANLASYIDPGVAPPDSSIEVCVVRLDDLPAYGCTSHGAGMGFGNQSIASLGSIVATRVQATPSHANMDGVLALTDGPADAFGDLAAAVRFYTNGMIEARDGSTYRAVEPRTYGAGEEVWMYVVANHATKTYSAWASDPFGIAGGAIIAREFAFRPGAAADHLDTLARVVDSPEGALETCTTSSVPGHVHLAKLGAYQPLALPGDRALLVSATGSELLDPAGRVLATTDVTGHPVVDAAGHIHLVRVDADRAQLAVTMFTPELTRIATHALMLADPSVTIAAVAARENDILVALRDTDGVVRSIATKYPDGFSSSLIDVSAHAARGFTLHSDGFAFVRPGTGDTTIVGRGNADGSLRWSRAIPGTFTADLAIAEDGTVALAGWFSTPVSFGDQVLLPRHSDDADLSNFIAFLAADGSTRRSEHLLTAEVNGLVTNGARFALSSTLRTQFHYAELAIYETDGTAVRTWNEAGAAFGFSDWSRAGSVALGASGRVLYQLHDQGLDRYPGIPLMLAIGP